MAAKIGVEGRAGITCEVSRSRRSGITIRLAHRLRGHTKHMKMFGQRVMSRHTHVRRTDDAVQDRGDELSLDHESDPCQGKTCVTNKRTRRKGELHGEHCIKY